MSAIELGIVPGTFTDETGWYPVDKLTVDFLSGARLETLLWKSWVRENFQITGLIYAIILLLSWGTLVLELALAFGLWFKRFQIPLIVSALFMHFLMYIWLNIGPFSLMMAAVLMLFYFLVFHGYYNDAATPRKSVAYISK